MDVAFSQFKKGDCKKKEIVPQEQSLLRSWKPALQVSFDGESADTLLLFQNEIEKQVLRDFAG